jgi:NADH-quinone oxidoreductase subunit J
MLSSILVNIWVYLILFQLGLILVHFLYSFQVIVLLIITGSMFLISGLLLAFIGAEFVGLTLILVYVGAILVLFLYVVMLVNVKPYVNNVSFYKQQAMFLFIFITICVWFNFLLFLTEDSLSFLELSYNINSIGSVTFDLKNFGFLLYSSRFFDLYILAFILLLGVFGILLLILRKVENRKIQDDLRQIMIKKYVNVF